MSMVMTCLLSCAAIVAQVNTDAVATVGEAVSSLDKLKARLVAGGHQQNRSICTEEETVSPTVATASVFTCATIAAHERRHVITMDIGAAFLSADKLPDKPVFMKLDPVTSAILTHLDREYEEYTQQNGSVIVKLDKALYGCVQSAALWYYDLRKTLESNMLICNPYDTCVFNKTEDGVQTTVLFHVDDLMASSITDECLMNSTTYWCLNMEK